MNREERDSVRQRRGWTADKVTSCLSREGLVCGRGGLFVGQGLVCAMGDVVCLCGQGAYLCETGLVCGRGRLLVGYGACLWERGLVSGGRGLFRLRSL